MTSLMSRTRDSLRKVAPLFLALAIVPAFTSDASAQYGRGFYNRGYYTRYYSRGYGGGYGGYGGFNRGYGFYNRGYGGYGGYGGFAGPRYYGNNFGFYGSGVPYRYGIVAPYARSFGYGFRRFDRD